MPLPPEVLALGDPLIEAYARAQREIDAEMAAIAHDPARAARRGRLSEMRHRVDAMMDDVDGSLTRWSTGPARTIAKFGAIAGGADNTWNVLRDDAVLEVLNETHDDLLQATQYVRDDTKRLIRSTLAPGIVDKMVQGQTATEAAKEMSALLREQGIRAIRYANGSRYHLDTYAQMAVRTTSALAYNTATLNANPKGYYEVFDGPSCGWASHADADRADGKIIPASEGIRVRVAHPACQRVFSLRPDVKTAKEAKEAERSTTPEQRADAAKAERERIRAAQEARRRRKGATVRDQRERRLQAREARLGTTRTARQRRVAAGQPTPVAPPPAPRMGRLVTQGQRKRIDGEWEIDPAPMDAGRRSLYASQDHRYLADGGQRAANLWQRTYGGNTFIRQAMENLRAGRAALDGLDFDTDWVRALTRVPEMYDKADFAADVEGSARFMSDGLARARPGPELWRGTRSTAVPEVGDEGDWSPQSWSSQPQVAAHFGHRYPGDGKEVLYRLDEGTPAMDLSPHAVDAAADASGMHEWVSAPGRFRVIGVEDVPEEQLPSKVVGRKGPVVDAYRIVRLRRLP